MIVVSGTGSGFHVSVVCFPISKLNYDQPHLTGATAARTCQIDKTVGSNWVSGHGVNFRGPLYHAIGLIITWTSACQSQGMRLGIQPDTLCQHFFTLDTFIGERNLQMWPFSYPESEDSKNQQTLI